MKRSKKYAYCIIFFSPLFSRRDSWRRRDEDTRKEQLKFTIAACANDSKFAISDKESFEGNLESLHKFKKKLLEKFIKFKQFS